MQQFQKTTKKRRFSQSSTSLQNIFTKMDNSVNGKPQLKFNKIDRKFLSPRRSSQLQTNLKCQENLDRIKRQTQWYKVKIESKQLNKILQKRNKKIRFNFNTSDSKGIKHRSQNSVYEDNHSQTIQNQTNQPKNLSLAKESHQLTQLQKQIKYFKQKQVQQTAKNRILSQMLSLVRTQLLQQQIRQQQGQKYISQEENCSLFMKKQQTRMEYFIRYTDEIKQKIGLYKERIVSLRSQRVVYSSIFKQLEKQIKYKENLYNKTLINSCEYIENIYRPQINNQKGVVIDQSYQLRQRQPMNSYIDYKSLLFTTTLNSVNVQFINSNGNQNDQQQNYSTFHDKINSNAAINYFTQTRKVIILPRYKEHSQSSRKKVRLQKQESYYQEVLSQITKIFIALQLGYDGINSIDSDSNQRPSNFIQQNDQPPRNKPSLQQPITCSQHTKNQSNTTINRYNLLQQNTTINRYNLLQHSIKHYIQKIHLMCQKLPPDNQSLRHKVEYIQGQICQVKTKIQCQKNKLKLFKTSSETASIGNGIVGKQGYFQLQLQKLKSQHNREQDQKRCLGQIQQISRLFHMDQKRLKDEQLENKLNILENLCYLTQTENNKSEEQKVEMKETNQRQDKSKQTNSDRSDISIKFKKLQNNSPISHTKDTKETILRSPKTLNSILKDIKVYDWYQKAFQRMDFQKQYQIEKNKKKNTLIRKDGKVSLGLIKKQAQSKNRLLPRKPPNRQQC